MESDPFLSNVSHLLLDEIHERNTECDFIITLLKSVLQRRKDLKLILMSATFNAESFAKYFEGVCDTVTIPGFTFPVKQYYLEDVLNKIPHEFPPVRKKYGKKFAKYSQQRNDYHEMIEPYIQDILSTKRYPLSVCKELINPNSEEIDSELIEKLIADICHDENGAILVFLPGYKDIKNLHQTLLRSNKYPSSRYLIYQLHSKLPTIQQKQVFDEPPPGKRKIILSTNIAETSITINDVVYVIDCGKIKLNNYDAAKNIESLKPCWVSIANADQRKGRAGRVRPGVCYHLFTRARKMLLDMQHPPEILRQRLENVILQIKILKLGKAEVFLNKIMDSPSVEAIQKSLSILRKMTALDEQEKLTPLGYHLAKLPMGPQMGKMVLMGALFSCLDPILSIAASLDFKDAFQIPLGQEWKAYEKKRSLSDGWFSDHLVLHTALTRYLKEKSKGNGRKFCYEYFLNSTTLDLLNDMKKQLVEYLHEMKFITDTNYKDHKWNINSNCNSLIKAIVAAGLYPNVAIVRNKERSKFTFYETVEGEKVSVVKDSVNAQVRKFASPLLIYYLKLESQNSISLFDTTMIYPLPLFFFGDYMDEQIDLDENIIQLPTKVPLKFHCKQEVAKLIKDLRMRLDNILSYKVSNPGVIDWTNNSDEVHVLRYVCHQLCIAMFIIYDLNINVNTYLCFIMSIYDFNTLRFTFILQKINFLKVSRLAFIFNED